MSPYMCFLLSFYSPSAAHGVLTVLGHQLALSIFYSPQNEVLEL